MRGWKRQNVAVFKSLLDKKRAFNQCRFLFFYKHFPLRSEDFVWKDAKEAKKKPTKNVNALTKNNDINMEKDPKKIIFSKKIMFH